MTINAIEVRERPSQTRGIRLLGEQDGVDVFWTVTSSFAEKKAKAVLIPIAKGQINTENELSNVANKYLFCETLSN